MGDEEGVMPLPSWGGGLRCSMEHVLLSDLAFSRAASSAGGIPYNGAPTGPFFIPPSADTVLSEHYWFWIGDYAAHLRSTCELVSAYLTSVGRSSNLILNMAPNTTGGLDPGDVRAYAAMGDAIACLWGEPLGEVLGVELDADGVAVLPWPTPFVVAYAPRISVQLQEALNGTGQRIGGWSLDACIGPTGDASCALGAWVPLVAGLPTNATTGIGHKRIVEVTLPPSTVVSELGAESVLTALRFTALSAFSWVPDLAEPLRLARIALFNWTAVAGGCVPAGCTLPRY